MRPVPLLLLLITTTTFTAANYLTSIGSHAATEICDVAVIVALVLIRALDAPLHPPMRLLLLQFLLPGPLLLLRMRPRLVSVPLLLPPRHSQSLALVALESEFRSRGWLTGEAGQECGMTRSRLVNRTAAQSR